MGIIVGSPSVTIRDDGSVVVVFDNAAIHDREFQVYHLEFPDQMAAAEYADAIFNNKSLVGNNVARAIMRAILGQPGGPPVGWRGWQR